MIRLIQLNLERTIEAGHHIPNHKGKCKNKHGHSYRIQVSIQGLHDSKDGIFIDYGDIKQVLDRFDHTYLNDFFKIPSAENMSRFFALKIFRLNRDIVESTVTVFETEKAAATTSIYKHEKEAKESYEGEH